MMLKEHEELGFEYPATDPGLALHQMHHGNNIRGCFCHGCTKILDSHGETRLHDMIFENGKIDLNDADAKRGHQEMVQIQQEKEASEKHLGPIRWKQKSLAAENEKTLDGHIIEFMEPEILNHDRSDPIRKRREDFLRSTNFPLGKVHTSAHSSNSNHPIEREAPISINKRVTIHSLSKHRTTSEGQYGKLITLPDSLEELLRIAGKHYLKILRN